MKRHSRQKSTGRPSENFYASLSSSPKSNNQVEDSWRSTNQRSSQQWRNEDGKGKWGKVQTPAPKTKSVSTDIPFLAKLREKSVVFSNIPIGRNAREQEAIKSAFLGAIKSHGVMLPRFVTKEDIVKGNGEMMFTLHSVEDVEKLTNQNRGFRVISPTRSNQWRPQWGKVTVKRLNRETKFAKPWRTKLWTRIQDHLTPLVEYFQQQWDEGRTYIPVGELFSCTQSEDIKKHSSELQNFTGVGDRCLHVVFKQAASIIEAQHGLSISVRNTSKGQQIVLENQRQQNRPRQNQRMEPSFVPTVTPGGYSRPGVTPPQYPQSQPRGPAPTWNTSVAPSIPRNEDMMQKPRSTSARWAQPIPMGPTSDDGQNIADDCSEPSRPPSMTSQSSKHTDVTDMFSSINLDMLPRRKDHSEPQVCEMDVPMKKRKRSACSTMSMPSISDVLSTTSSSGKSSGKGSESDNWRDARPSSRNNGLKKSGGGVFKPRRLLNSYANPGMMGSSYGCPEDTNRPTCAPYVDYIPRKMSPPVNMPTDLPDSPPANPSSSWDGPAPLSQELPTGIPAVPSSMVAQPSHTLHWDQSSQPGSESICPSVASTAIPQEGQPGGQRLEDTPLENWTTEQVGMWVRSLAKNVARYAECLEDNDIDGTLLDGMADYMDDLGMESVDGFKPLHKRVLMKKIGQLVKRMSSKIQDEREGQVKGTGR